MHLPVFSFESDNVIAVVIIQLLYCNCSFFSESVFIIIIVTMGVRIVNIVAIAAVASCMLSAAGGDTTHHRSKRYFFINPDAPITLGKRTLHLFHFN